jgi:hypothetical protein
MNKKSSPQTSLDELMRGESYEEIAVIGVRAAGRIIPYLAKGAEHSANRGNFALPCFRALSGAWLNNLGKIDVDHYLRESANDATIAAARFSSLDQKHGRDYAGLVSTGVARTARRSLRRMSGYDSDRLVIDDLVRSDRFELHPDWSEPLGSHVLSESPGFS